MVRTQGQKTLKHSEYKTKRFVTSYQKSAQNLIEFSSNIDFVDKIKEEKELNAADNVKIKNHTKLAFYPSGGVHCSNFSA